MSHGPGNGVRGQRVRPAIRRLAIVAVVILLPVAAHSLWDYVEIRRLVREIEAVRERGEPVTEREAVGSERPQPSVDPSAAAYYLAGAALALGSSPWSAINAVREWLAQPVPDRRALPTFAAPLDTLVQESKDALTLADKGAARPFVRFPAGTEYSYRTAGVYSLSGLITARTLGLSLSGEGDAAVRSVIIGLHIRRALRESAWWFVSEPLVPAVLSLSQPSPAALEALQSALEQEDKPEQPREDLLGARARFIEMIWQRYYGIDPSASAQYSLPTRSMMETLLRPLITHRTVALLRVWPELIDVATSPFPQRAVRSAAVLKKYKGRWDAPRHSVVAALLSLGDTSGTFEQAVDPTGLIVDRCSRVATAVERFRRDTGRLPAALADLVPRYLTDVPMDPYSGDPLVFRSGVDAYTIYSVGPNQHDDGGDLTSELQRVIERGWGRRVIRGADVGIRVLTQH